MESTGWLNILMKRLAFFGGTFDPPHRGHLAVARAAADQFALDQVLFAPVARQPFKPGEAATPFLHRYAMTALVTQADPRFIPSLLDAPRTDAPDAPNYTVDTLDRLRSSLASSPDPFELFALLGADSWLQIARWHHACRLLTLCDWIVAARPGFSLHHAEQALPAGIHAEPLPHGTHRGLLLHHAGEARTRVLFLDHLHEEVSATALRDDLANGPVEPDLLPQSVREYILKTHLYFAAK